MVFSEKSLIFFLRFCDYCLYGSCSSQTHAVLSTYYRHKICFSRIWFRARCSFPTSSLTLVLRLRTGAYNNDKIFMCVCGKKKLRKYTGGYNINKNILMHVCVKVNTPHHEYKLRCTQFHKQNFCLKSTASKTKIPALLQNNNNNKQAPESYIKLCVGIPVLVNFFLWFSDACKSCMLCELLHTKWSTLASRAPYEIYMLRM